MLFASVETKRVLAASARKNAKMSRDKKKTILATLLQRQHWESVKQIALEEHQIEQKWRDEVWFSLLPPFPRLPNHLQQTPAQTDAPALERQPSVCDDSFDDEKEE